MNHNNSDYLSEVHCALLTLHCSKIWGDNITTWGDDLLLSSNSIIRHIRPKIKNYLAKYRIMEKGQIFGTPKIISMEK